MNSVDEDLSARILLQNVIQTESSRSPITRSASQAQFQSPGSRVRYSIRLRRSDVGALTPQEALKQSIKKKLRESTSRSSLPEPPSKRWAVSEGVGKINTPAPATASLLYDDDITPRYLLRGILQTEPETSLLVQDRPVRKEPELPSTNSSLHSNRPSTGLSELDLPDMTTTVNLSNTVKGLSRKRPCRSLNITAFNRQLEHEDGEGGSATEKDLSSLSSASPSSITFSLKTPFVDIRTEKRRFQRKVANRKKICLDEFDEALRNRQAAMGGDPKLSVREDQQGLSETVRSEGFTLGLSDLTAPDITHDIITSKTELYAPPDDTATTFTIATQDKDTIIGTQIQREMGGMKDEEEKDMEVVGEQKEYTMEIDNKGGEDLAVDAGQREALVRQEESKSQTEEVADSRTGEDEELAKSQTEGEVAESPTEGEVAESPTEGEVAESPTEGEVAESPTEGEVAESPTEGEVAESPTEGEVAESPSEGEVAESPSEGEVAEVSVRRRGSRVSVRRRGSRVSVRRRGSRVSVRRRGSRVSVRRRGSRVSVRRRGSRVSVRRRGSRVSVRRRGSRVSVRRRGSRVSDRRRGSRVSDRRRGSRVSDRRRGSRVSVRRRGSRVSVRRRGSRVSDRRRGSRVSDRRRGSRVSDRRRGSRVSDRRGGGDD
nr:centromere protein T-like [Oncorhynchus nerka]